MDFGRGLSFVRQDPNWLVKTLLGSVISLVPILNFAATGYGLDVLRNVHAGHETPLPEWGENFGDRWVRGLIAFVISFIYTLPIIVLACGWGLVTSMSAAAAQTEEAVASGSAALALCGVPLFLLAALFLGSLAMVAQARYSITNQFSEAMRFGSVIAEWRSGLGRWLGVIGMLFVVGLAFGIFGLVTCGLGYLLSFYLVLAQNHWVGQAYRESAGAPEHVPSTL